jgi:cytochrome d ubiquinol oxidase subunit II
MTLENAVAAAMFAGVVTYAVLGGADFGSGFWDLTAGNAERGGRTRALIDHSIGPVWEANHVWLIYVLVIWWTGFPESFAAAMSTLVLPLLLALLGIVLRGASFAFRKYAATLAQARLFGIVFATSSIITPFFLGTVAGAVASGRVPPGIAQGDIIRSWLNPTSVFGGVLAVATCAYLAAVFLCADAERAGDRALVAWFRTRAIATALLVGLLALGGIAVLRADAPLLSTGLTHRGLPLVVLSALAGLASILLVVRNRFVLARAAAGLAVTAVIWGWAAAQYPWLLPPDLTIAQAAAPRATLVAMLVSLVIGAVLLVPSLVFLFALFQRSQRAR